MVRQLTACDEDDFADGDGDDAGDGDGECYHDGDDDVDLILTVELGRGDLRSNGNHWNSTDS